MSTPPAASGKALRSALKKTDTGHGGLPGPPVIRVVRFQDSPLYQRFVLRNSGEGYRGDGDGVRFMKRDSSGKGVRVVSRKMFEEETSVAVSSIEHVLECPVCAEVPQTPRSLSCGHFICDGCVVRLRKPTLATGKFCNYEISCPSCRQNMQYRDNPPTNYAIANMVDELKEAAAAKARAHRHQCNSCNEVLKPNKSFLCAPCNKQMLCAYCALQKHAGHQLINLQDAIATEQARIDKWMDTARPKQERLEQWCRDLHMRTIDFANEIHDLASKLETEAINYVSQFDKKATLMVENTESTINRIKEDDVDFASQPQDLNDSFARADDILMRNLAVSVVADERLKEISETLRRFRAEFFPKLARIRRKEEDFSTDKPGSRCRKREHPEQAGCSFWSSDSMVESPRIEFNPRRFGRSRSEETDLDVQSPVIKLEPEDDEYEET